MRELAGFSSLSPNPKIPILSTQSYSTLSILPPKKDLNGIGYLAGVSSLSMGICWPNPQRNQNKLFLTSS